MNPCGAWSVTHIVRPQIKTGIDCTRTTFQTMMDAVAAKDPWGRVEGFRRFQWAICSCATVVIEKILSDIRRHKDGLATSLDESADKMAEVMKSSAAADSLEANAEEFVGLVYIYAIQHVLMDIRSHILAFTFGYFFLLLALNAYPVGPHHSIMIMLLTIFAGFVLTVFIVFSQMHRDPSSAAPHRRSPENSTSASIRSSFLCSACPSSGCSHRNSRRSATSSSPGSSPACRP